MSLVLRAAAVLLVLAQMPAQEQRARGEFFEVVLHGVATKPDAERIAAQALAAVEPVWPRVCEALGAGARTPDEPLQVHLYRAVDGYERADQRLSGGRFQRNQAMSHWRSKSAHVALQPAVTDRFLAAEGLPLQTEAMLAWEACHIARYELCPGNFKLHPGWFKDGLAETTSCAVMMARYGLTVDPPFYRTRWLRVQQLLSDDKLPTVRRLLRDQTSSLAMRDRYAARVALYRFLSNRHADALRDFARQLRAEAGGTAYAGKLSELAAEAFDDTDAAFRAHVLTVRCDWRERDRSLWCIGDEWRQIAFPDHDALAWRVAPVTGGAFTATGTLRFLPTGRRQMHFLFGRTDAGCYVLSLFPAGFTLFENIYDGNHWRRIGTRRRSAAPNGEDIALVVRGSGRDVTFDLDGRSWQLRLPRKLPDEVFWGIGAKSGSGSATGTAGVWRGMTVTRE